MKDIDSFSGRYAFLSNFSPASVYILIGTKWIRCVTVEHAYQASKTCNQYWRRKIVDTSTPEDAKRLGQRAPLAVYWDDVKTVIMIELLRQKFSSSQFRRRLIATGQMDLIEGNHWHDNFWGSCRCTACQLVEGQNWLGILLMRVRKDIR